jgi:MFS family permease
MRRPSVEPTIYAIIAEGFTSRLSFGIISFALPLYAHHLGLSLTAVGLLVSLNVVVAMALKPSMGWFADRYGLKRGYVAALVVRSLVSLLLAVAAQPWHLYALRSAHGVATALRDPAAGALIAERSAKKIIASSFAWYGTAKSVAGALGHAVAGTLLTLTADNYSAVFIASALLSVGALPVVVRFVPERRGNQSAPAAGDMAASPAADPHPDRRDARDGLRPRLLPIMGLGFLISGTAKMIWGLFPVLAVEYAGLTTAEAGLISLVTAVVRLVAGPVFGWLSDNVSRNLVLSVRSGANVLSSVLFLSSPNFHGMLAGRVIDDAGKAAFMPAWGALMAGASDHDPRNRARTMGVLSLGEDAGDAAGPIVAGFLWSTWGVGALFGVRIVLAILTELYTIALVRSGIVGDGRGQRAVVRAGTGRSGRARGAGAATMADTTAGQEPSMEEILSLIRRTIAEDDAVAEPARATGAMPPRDKADDGDDEDVLELTDVVAGPEPPPAAAMQPAAPLAAAAAPTRPANPTPENRSMPAEAAEALVSPLAANASAQALARLARAAATEEKKAAPIGGVTVEELLVDLLTPMLKDCLDKHLPKIVERVVEQEMKKLARRTELM